MEHLLNALENSLGSKCKGWTLTVKLKGQNDSVSICFEQGHMVVLNITNLCVVPNEQCIIVYWDKLALSIFSVGNTCITFKRFCIKTTVTTPLTLDIKIQHLFLHSGMSIGQYAAMTEVVFLRGSLILNRMAAIVVLSYFSPQQTSQEWHSHLIKGD